MCRPFRLIRSKSFFLLLALITFNAFLVVKAQNDSDEGGGADDAGGDASAAEGDDTDGGDQQESGENTDEHDNDNNGGSDAEAESGQNEEHNAQDSEEDQNQQHDDDESTDEEEQKSGGRGGGKAGKKDGGKGKAEGKAGGGKGGKRKAGGEEEAGEKKKAKGGAKSNKQNSKDGKERPNTAGQGQPPVNPPASGNAQPSGNFQPGGGQQPLPPAPSSPSYPSPNYPLSPSYPPLSPPSYPQYPIYQQHQSDPYYSSNPYYAGYRQPYDAYAQTYQSGDYYDNRQNRPGSDDRRDFYNGRRNYYENRRDFYDDTNFGFGGASSSTNGRSFPPVINENNFDPGHAQGRLAGATFVPREEQSRLPPVMYGSARRFRRSVTAAGSKMQMRNNFVNPYLFPDPQSAGHKRMQIRRNGGRRTKRRQMLCFVPSPETRQNGNMDFWRYNLLKYSPNQFQRHFPYSFRTNGEMYGQDNWRRRRRQSDFPGAFPAENWRGDYGSGGESNPSLICQPMENNGYGNRGDDGGRGSLPGYSNGYGSDSDGRGGGRGISNNDNPNDNYDYGNGAGRGNTITNNNNNKYGNSDGRKGQKSERNGKDRQQPRR